MVCDPPLGPASSPLWVSSWTSSIRAGSTCRTSAATSIREELTPEMSTEPTWTWIEPSPPAQTSAAAGAAAPGQAPIARPMPSPGQQGSALLPERMLGSRSRHCAEPQARPRLAAAHGVPVAGDIRQAPLERIQVQLAQRLVDRLFERERRRRRARRPVRAGRLLRGQDVERLDVDVLAAIVPAEQDREDPAFTPSDTRRCRAPLAPAARSRRAPSIRPARDRPRSPARGWWRGSPRSG